MTIDFTTGIPDQQLEQSLLSSWLASDQETEANRKVPKGQYLLARMDGRAFSAFTQPMKKPFDKTFTDLMIETTKHVMKMLGPNLGFTQSDEMTFVWWMPADMPGDYPFSGRLQKICSLGAAAASTYFASNIEYRLRELSETEEERISIDRILGHPPMFDCRAWGAYDDAAALEAFMDRERDCRRNAVSMVAHTFISPKKLHGIPTRDRLAMLKELNVNYESYPLENRKGSYIIRKRYERLLTAQELRKIPVEHQEPNHTVIKTSYERASWGSLTDVGVLALQQSTWPKEPTNS